MFRTLIFVSIEYNFTHTFPMILFPLSFIRLSYKCGKPIQLLDSGRENSWKEALLIELAGGASTVLGFGLMCHLQIFKSFILVNKMLSEKLSDIYYVHQYTLKSNLTLQKYFQIGVSCGQIILLMILRHRFSIMWYNGFALPLCSVKVLNHLFVQMI